MGTYRKTIKLPRERCLSELIHLFDEDKKISFTKQSEYEITFKKGSMWDLQFRVRDVSLKGEIDLLGDGNTIIKIFFNRTAYLVFLSILEMEMLVLFFMLNFSNSADLLSQILIILLIAEVITMPIYWAWKLNAAERLFSNNIFNKLNDLLA